MCTRVRYFSIILFFNEHYRVSAQPSPAQLSSYSPSFVLLKSQHISLYLHFYSVVLSASFCLSHTGLFSVVFSFLFNANNISIQINTRILGFLSFVFVCCCVTFLSGWLCICMHACVYMGVCPCGRHIKMREVHLFFISFCFHILCLAFTCCAISAMLLSFFFFSTFFPLLFYLCECIS